MDNRNYDGILWTQKPNGYWVNGKREYQHRYVYEKLTGLKVFDYQVVHHLDSDPSNNTAENLVCMNKEDHYYLHGKIKIGKKRPLWVRDKISKKMNGIKRSEETRKKISESGKGRIPWNKGKTGNLEIY